MTENRPTATVFMSTYNGERFIAEQMDSIMAQRDVEVKLMIRDDGSSDDTISIIRGREGNIQLIRGEHLGVGNSFLELVYSGGNDSDYYAFSDQDDIWMPEKLKMAVNSIKDMEGPVLYASNLILVDKDGSYLDEKTDSAEQAEWLQCVCGNNIRGCTMVWNRAFQEMVSREERRPSAELLRRRIHDVWFVTVASVLGVLVFDDNAYICYRQHENNVCGAGKVTFRRIWKNRIRKIADPSLRNGRSDICREICKRYADMIEDGGILGDLEMIGTYKENRNSKRALLKYRGIVEHSGDTYLFFKLKVLAGLV